MGAGQAADLIGRSQTLCYGAHLSYAFHDSDGQTRIPTRSGSCRLRIGGS